MTAILAELLRSGLESLPKLVVYEFDSASMRVILRGDMTATVESADGSAETSTGHARRTWLEQVFLSAVSGTVGDMDMGEVDLPLHIGITMAGGFTFSAGDSIHGKSASRGSTSANDNARILPYRRSRSESAGGQKALSLVERPSESGATRRSQ